jgi:hypothetical protein
MLLKHKIGILHTAPTDDELNDQLKLLFESADSDGDGEISIDEFAFYARDHAWNASVLEHHEGKGGRKKKHADVKPGGPGGGGTGKAKRRLSHTDTKVEKRKTAAECRQQRAAAELKFHGHVSETTGAIHLSKSEMHDLAQKQVWVWLYSLTFLSSHMFLSYTPLIAHVPFIHSSHLTHSSHTLLLSHTLLSHTPLIHSSHTDQETGPDCEPEDSTRYLSQNQL